MEPPARPRPRAGPSRNQPRISGELEKCEFCGKNKSHLLFYAVQVALPYYIREMVKFMSRDSIALEAELEMQGHPNLFKSKPVVTSKEWYLLQSLNVHTSLYTQEHTGA